MITDSHAHVWWDSFDADREDVFRRALESGVDRMVMVGTDVPSSRRCFELAEGRPGIFPTAGIHPHDAKDADEAARATIVELCARGDCVAVGETGLDYFKEYSPREAQRESFAWHLDLARTLDLPVIVHCRDAHEDTASLLADHPGVRGVMHCYTYGEEELGPYLDLGFYISFSGVVTFPKNASNRAAARAVPSDRLLVETDCPFLAPQGHRGKRNEPALVRRVLECVADERGEDFDALARATSENAARLFGLPGLPPENSASG